MNSEEFTYINDSILIDRAGRVVNPALIEYEDPTEPENLDEFVSSWQPQLLTQAIDSNLASRYVWPSEEKPVHLKRLDVYQSDNPLCQQSSSNLAESRRIRNSGLFYPLRSLFFMGHPTPSTTAVEVERVAPPPRTRLRPKSKKNARDQTIWTESESLNAFQGAVGCPGSVDCFIDWTDGPDRYLMSSKLDPVHGWRRLWRFAAYPATQYYILEKRVEHDIFKDDLGYGYTYELTRGPNVYAEKKWKLVGSFYAFDNELPCSNKYTVYTREDPFRRMVITMGESFDDADQWTVAFYFYAFDIPLPGSCVYYLNHSVRSINSTDAGVRRHRLTLEHPRLPWEFRMNIYVFPAALEDCTITQTAPASKVPMNWDEVPTEQLEYSTEEYYEQTY